MRHVVVAVTARPSYSRIKTALVALRARPDVRLSIVACASAVVTRFGRVADLIRADGFEVAAEVSSVVEEDSLSNSALSTGVLLTQLSGIFAGLKPEVVVTIADRHETLATAIAASYQNIPLCHIQGGEVSGSIDDKVRNAVTQLADVHCVATEMAADRVIDQRDYVNRAHGVQNPVHITGCPSVDLAAEAKRLGAFLHGKVMVLQHPVTTQTDQAADQMRATVEALKGMDTLYFWPGEDASGQAMSKVLRLAGIKPVRNISPLNFMRTLMGASCLVGNSSVGIRECSFLGVPVVNVGSRQQGRERAANVMDVPHDVDAIQQESARLSMMIKDGPFPSSHLYGDGHAGERIAAILSGRAIEAVA